MIDAPRRRPRLVGGFIRKRRESLGLSQRALGQLFSPPVTTQFISNVERGATPLPPAHVPTLAKALMVDEGELMAVLEQEYAVKLSGRLGHAAAPNVLQVHTEDQGFFHQLYESYRNASEKDRAAFRNVCQSILELDLNQKHFSRGEHDDDDESGSTPI